MNALHRWQRGVLLGLVRLIVGGSARYDAPLPDGQCVVFANHSSHLDTLVLLAAMPAFRRDRMRPVAGLDYWGATPLRRYIATRLLNVVMIDRAAGGAASLQPLHEALAAGDSLIVFPEGTRRAEALPGPFKAGLFHLTQGKPAIALIPAYLENMHRALPKGAPVPLPLLCRVRIGTAQAPAAPDEDKATFLERLHRAVCQLSEVPQ